MSVRGIRSCPACSRLLSHPNTAMPIAPPSASGTPGTPQRALPPLTKGCAQTLP